MDAFKVLSDKAARSRNGGASITGTTLEGRAAK